MKYFELFVYVIVALVGSAALANFISGWFARRRTSAETADVLSQAWNRSMERLTEQLQRQEDQILELQKKLEFAQHRINEQEIQIHKLQMEILRRDLRET